MQKDMHYYGVYCLARSAGIKKKAAEIIAYASQYIDDSTARDIDDHKDGSKIIAIPTAHHTMDLIRNLDLNHQREIWVPFHFMPGGKGTTFTSKLVCRKDSAIAREMVKNNLYHDEKAYVLHLLGITAHVYADTFAHYGFSGVSSRRNRIVGDTVKIEQSTELLEFLMGNKLATFFEKYGEQGGLLHNVRSFVSFAGEVGSGALGHGAVSVYPDQPFLRWSFDYEYPDMVTETKSMRDNQKTFLEACEKLYNLFTDFLAIHKQHFDIASRVEFLEIKPKIKEILALEVSKEERCDAWVKALKKGEVSGKKEKLPIYDADKWENERDNFPKLTNAKDGAKLNVYKFYQAASYHRHYVLRELLPKHGIIVI